MILANHGVLSFGVDVAHMIRVAVAFEEAARVALLAQAIGGAAALPLAPARAN
jgi:ribulose-5-phosphate 4-epimerase/fuculose-1-phosphate aldolase